MKETEQYVDLMIVNQRIREDDSVDQQVNVIPLMFPQEATTTLTANIIHAKKTGRVPMTTINVDCGNKIKTYPKRAILDVWALETEGKDHTV